MPGNLTNLVSIQTELANLQLALNNVTTAVAQQGGAVISTAALQTALNTVVATVNAAVINPANNTIVGNQ